MDDSRSRGQQQEEEGLQQEVGEVGKEQQHEQEDAAACLAGFPFH